MLRHLKSLLHEVKRREMYGSQRRLYGRQQWLTRASPGDHGCPIEHRGRRRQRKATEPRHGDGWPRFLADLATDECKNRIKWLVSSPFFIISSYCHYFYSSRPEHVFNTWGKQDGCYNTPICSRWTCSRYNQLLWRGNWKKARTTRKERRKVCGPDQAVVAQKTRLWPWETDAWAYCGIWELDREIKLKWNCEIHSEIFDLHLRLRYQHALCREDSGCLQTPSFPYGVRIGYTRQR